MTAPFAIVHDYLTQRGGAERVVLSMLKAFPSAPVYTSFYDPEATFPEFRSVEVRTLPINRAAPLRRRHRMALPMLAHTFSRLTVQADVVLCSTSGWAHGTRVRGRKVVYCYTPARWLYQPGSYLRGANPATRAALNAMRPYLSRWDRQAAASADAYITSSSAVRERIREAYGLQAELIPPPHAIDSGGARHPVAGVPEGSFLCVSRLLPYKNLDAIVAAFRLLPDRHLVLVGNGPIGPRLRRSAPANVLFRTRVTDAELRWLYSSCRALVAASYEDFGLTPLEAAAFGKPAAVLRWGGFLDTVVEDETGVFFDAPAPESIAAALRRLEVTKLSPGRILAHVERFSEANFIRALRKATTLQSGDPGAATVPLKFDEAGVRSEAVAG
ncbi:MAG: glycosyltransferase [Candidatus Dormibacteraeota bacterium]|nr:glycosyltransferase [Candidatus Dormibacteraeota bacterium]